MARPAALLRQLDALIAEAEAKRDAAGPNPLANLSPQGVALIRHWESTRSPLQQFEQLDDHPAAPLFTLPSSLTLDELETRYLTLKDTIKPRNLT